jgi:hypothetical protein
MFKKTPNYQQHKNVKISILELSINNNLKLVFTESGLHFELIAHLF